MFSEVFQDPADLTTQVIDPAAQRMAEYLSTEGNVSVDKIAQLSGLDTHSLEKILQDRPSFTARWNQGFSILVDDLTAF